MTSGRIGVGLVLGGCVLWLATGALRGDVSPVGTGLRVLSDLSLSASLALACAGMLVLAIAGPGPLGDDVARLGLGIVGVGLGSLLVATLVPIPPGTNSLQSWPYIISNGLGLLSIALGLLLTGVALLRSRAARR